MHKIKYSKPSSLSHAFSLNGHPGGKFSSGQLLQKLTEVCSALQPIQGIAALPHHGKSELHNFEYTGIFIWI